MSPCSIPLPAIDPTHGNFRRSLAAFFANLFSKRARAQHCRICDTDGSKEQVVGTYRVGWPPQLTALNNGSLSNDHNRHKLRCMKQCDTTPSKQSDYKSCAYSKLSPSTCYNPSLRSIVSTQGWVKMALPFSTMCAQQRTLLYTLTCRAKINHLRPSITASRSSP